MYDQTRVLLRKGARELNEQEVELVNGGFHTLTLCTVPAAGGYDGDPGECSGV